MSCSPGSPSFFNSRLVGYVWETNAPVGTILRSRKNPMVHYIVVRSGVGNLDQWITEKRKREWMTIGASSGPIRRKSAASR